ncbi:OmpA family protein [Moraxella marmotae]|uniref:OmpA family protein n=1 Tax=Moraxella marmotae TaxID=3344520 RepID=UPI0035D43DE9
MNLMNKLQNLTPHILAVLKNHAGDNAGKTNVLNAFYAIFAARLSDEAVYQQAAALPNNAEYGERLLDVVLGDAKTVGGQLADHYQVASDTVWPALATAAPLAFDCIKQLAGDVSVPAFLRSQLADESQHLPAWALALLPAGLFAGTAAASTATATNTAGVANAVNVADTANAVNATNTATPTATHIDTKAAQAVSDETKGGFLKTLLPIIGLLIFGGVAWLLLRACQENPTPVAAPAPTSQAADAKSMDTASQAPATLSLAVDETGQAIYSCQAKAGDEALAGTIRAAVAQVFGTDKLGDNAIQVATKYANTMPAAEHLPEILALMKGVPSSSIRIDGEHVYFNAATPDQAAKLVEAAKGILPQGFSVEVEPELDIAAAVTSSIESAQAAINDLGETLEADETEAFIQALNLQIINFATDSSEIPDANKQILDLTAAKIANAPEVALRIIGHTDNQGAYDYNQKLSESRALAVRDYLVSKGVSAERLSIQGASSDQPVASNATEQGRFQNRRIEFALWQADAPSK